MFPNSLMINIISSLFDNQKVIWFFDLFIINLFLNNNMRVIITCFFLLFSLLTTSQENHIYYHNQQIDTLISKYQLLRENETISVFRILLISHEAPEKIQKSKKSYLKHYPLEIVEETFEPPYFKAVTGAYLDKKDADKKREKIKNKFKSSFVFQENISVETFKQHHY